MSKIRTWVASPTTDDTEPVEVHAPHNIKSATAKDMCLDAGRDSDMVHIVQCYRIELVQEPPVPGAYTREHCCQCNDQIWVSERAQDLRNFGKKVAVMCLWCSALVNGEFVDYEDGNYIIIRGGAND